MALLFVFVAVTYGQVFEVRPFEGDNLRILAWAFFGLSAGTLILNTARLRKRDAQGTAAVRLTSDGPIVGAVAQELEGVRRQRQLEDWTPRLAGRALAALRVAGAYALSRHVAQVAATPGIEAREGEVLVPAPRVSSNGLPDATSRPRSMTCTSSASRSASSM